MYLLRFISCYLSLIVIGVGSFLFHASLLYHMQLADEVPMVWGTCVIAYCVFSVSAPNL